MQTTEIKLDTVLYGKSEEQLKEFPDNFFGGIITDPPYGISFMGRDWDDFSNNTNSALGGQSPANMKNGTPFKIRGKPIAGWCKKDRDAAKNFQDWFYNIAIEMLRVSKPGSFLLCFGGTRTYHRVACAIEDAGWLIRDSINWIYGEGFPKSTNIGKQLDKEAGVEREQIWDTKTHNTTGGRDGIVRPKRPWVDEVIKNGGHFVDGNIPVTNDAKRWDGYGIALKPAHEPIIVAMKPLEKGLTYAQNAKKWGVAGLNIDGGRIGTNPGYKYNADKNGTTFHGNKGERIKQTAEKKGQQFIESTKGRWPANVILSHSPDCVCIGAKQIGNGEYKKHTVENAKSSWKNSSKNIEATAYGQETIEVYACVPGCPIRIMDGQSGILKSGDLKPYKENHQNATSYRFDREKTYNKKGDSGGASRFFYCAKAKRTEKEAGLEDCIECVKCGKFETKTHTITVDGKKKQEKCLRNSHPTVKPLDLMRYLINLIKMPTSSFEEAEENKQVILDPFCGSGTTLVALEQLGINYIGIEQDFDNVLISTARVG